MDAADATAQLLALEQAREARRVRRNRVLAWAVAVLVVLGVLVGVGVSRHAAQVREQQAQRDLFCRMVGGCP